MKTTLTLVRLLAIMAGLIPLTSLAQLNIPSDGSDGVLIIETNTVIDLSKAVTGAWNSNNAANAGRGIYDPAKWAVVFKYASVIISNDATVTFSNHPSRAPVVWLVQGDVTIDGTVSLDGETASYNAPKLSEPGPGGFRGGQGAYTSGAWTGAGFGPGGGGSLSGNWGSGGSYGSLGVNGSTTYGNPSIIPLIGGSGGGGYWGSGQGGGGGGGAILVATPSTISVSGILRANGGGNYQGGVGGGSGGAIRLIADAINGAGKVECIGGTIGAHPGGRGRIRIERVNSNAIADVVPDPSVVPLQAGATPLIWPPETAPTARIVSVGQTNAPADPRASFGAFGADVALPQTTTTTVVVETTNAEDASVVKVRVTPRSNANYTETDAVLTQVISENPKVIRWTAEVPVTDGYSAVQARVIRP